MPLYFHNGRSSKLYSAWGMWYPSTCPESGFVIKGWFVFEPGESGQVSSDDMRGGSYLTYGFWEDGYEWAGEVDAELPNSAFEHCLGSMIHLNGKKVKFKSFPRFNGTHHVTFA